MHRMSSGMPEARARRLERLGASSVWDLVVVGGGATGLGVALDAALRGFSVVLLESHDFAGGTSSRSTKLLHGGVRYLAQGNIALVREALAERATVLRLAPHLAQPLPFVMPSFRWWQTPFYGLGLMAYDLMAGRAGLGRTEWLGPKATRGLLPGVAPQGLRGGVKYWDGQFDDARLALALARSAEAAGALLVNHTPVASVTRGGTAEAGIFEIEVSDRFDPGFRQTVRASCVVNATGVWVDGLREGGAGVRDPLVRPSQGVHVVVDREFLGGDHALLVPRTRDGRVLFAVPWLGKLILGTTDTPRQDLPREPEPFGEEMRFILDEASRVLARPVRETDVRSRWVGLRPLVAPPDDQASTRAISREHTIVADSQGLITVTGGKWTTYRSMAEDVLEHCFERRLLPRRNSCRTAEHLLAGAPGHAQTTVPLHRPPGPHLYGSAYTQVLACPGARNEIGMGLTEAMVRHAVRSEHAMTVEDVLARRWRALFLDARAAAAMAPRVAAILAAEGCPEPGENAFAALCAHYLPAPASHSKPAT